MIYTFIIKKKNDIIYDVKEEIYLSKVLVFGHQKPDTDSVTSALVLSYLKNQLGMNTEPRVLGDINNETEFVLDYFKFDRPKFLNDVRLQVKDVDYTKDCFLHENDSIYKGYKYMNETSIGTIPVIDENGKYKGAVSMKDVASNLINNDLRKINTSYDNLLEALNGKEILRFDKKFKERLFHQVTEVQLLWKILKLIKKVF